MSKGELLRYTQQRDNLLVRLREGFKGQSAFAYGSVIRAQGPFNDVDVMIASPEVQAAVPETVDGLPIQLDYEDSVGVLAHEATTTRDITCALDYEVIADKDQLLVAALDLRRAKLAKQSAYIIHLLALEETQETNGNDIQSGQSFYAAKRKSGGKRSIMRTCIVADAMYTDLDPTDPRTRFQRLNELGVIDDETLTAMFAVQSMLPHYRKGRKPEGWDYHLEITSAWTRSVTEQGFEYIKSISANSYSDIQSEVVADREMLANQNTSGDDLIKLWRKLECSPSRLREVATSLVQHDNFPLDEIRSAQVLQFLPDVQFLLRSKE